MTTTTAGAALFNAADYLVDRHVRGGAGDHTAVVGSVRTLSYGELAAEVHRFAGGLQRLGVGSQHRVMLCMADDAELLIGILGAMYLGAVAVPVSTMLTGPELGKLVVDSRARILCASTEFAGQIAVALTMAPEVTDIIFDSTPRTQTRANVSMHDWDAIMCADPIAPADDIYDDSPALWLYTSGTTGTPKAAVHRHGSIRAVAENYGAGVLGIVPQDRCLSVPKLFFAYGLGNSCFLPLSAGATTILDRARPDPATFADRIRIGQPTVVFAVPTFYSSLLGSDLPDDTFTGVRQGISAGEALPQTLFVRFRDRFGVEILDGIGSTEALYIFISNRRDQVRPGSSGVPVPGYEVQLRDAADGVITAAGQPGVLHLKGRSIASGYWCRPETTREVFRDGWLCTGDTCVRDTDGTYRYLSRAGDMIKAGGIWVAPAEVEERLLQHPDVAEAAVVAAADDCGLEKPVGCVVARVGRRIDADALIIWCRQGLAAFKRPRAIVAMAELPKTPTGKLRRNLLREQVASVLQKPTADVAASTKSEPGQSAC